MQYCYLASSCVSCEPPPNCSTCPNHRSEQVTKSLQAQMDILQVEVQQLGEEMESSRGAAIAASKYRSGVFF